QRVERMCGGTLGPKSHDPLGVQVGGQEAREQLAAAHTGRLLLGRRVDLEDDDALPRVVDDLGAGGGIGLVREAGRLARTPLDGDVIAELDELGDGGGSRSNPALSWSGLPWDSDAHELSCLQVRFFCRWIWKRRG